MSEEYRYRPHIAWMRKYGLRLMVVAGLAAAWAVVFGAMFVTEISPDLLVQIGAGASIFLAVEGYLLSLFLRRFEAIRVRMDDDAITYVNRKRVTRVPFDEIMELKFSSVPYTGGWIKIVSLQDTFRLTVVIENIGGLLDRLREALEVRGQTGCFNRRKFFRFYKTAVFSDRSWERVYGIFLRLVLLTLASMALGGGIIWIGRGALLTSLAYLFVVTMIPATANVFVEFPLIWRIGRLSKLEGFVTPPRDLALEARLYRLAFRIGVLGFLLASLAYLLLFTQSL